MGRQTEATDDVVQGVDEAAEPAKSRHWREFCKSQGSAVSEGDTSLIHAAFSFAWERSRQFSALEHLTAMGNIEREEQAGGPLARVRALNAKWREAPCCDHCLLCNNELEDAING